jgi:hypothetical protein
MRGGEAMAPPPQIYSMVKSTVVQCILTTKPSATPAKVVPKEPAVTGNVAAVV